MMPELRFYHLQNVDVWHALPGLLGKALQNGRRVLLKTGQVADWDRHLWTFNPESFLPHGREGEPHPDKQPAWIASDETERPNTPDMLLTAGDLWPEDPAAFDLVCVMFEDRDTEAMQTARSLWKQAKDGDLGDLNLTYWQQSAAGGWEKKAGA